MSKSPSDVILIELDEEAIGLAMRQRSGFRFFSAVRRFEALDGRDFRSLAHIETTARDLIRKRGASVRLPSGRRYEPPVFAGSMFAAA